ncbi:MAG: hypothetical protein AAGC93_05965 [Cyanobacteria bacterium P01_F01_bin.53]
MSPLNPPAPVQLNLPIPAQLSFLATGLNAGPTSGNLRCSSEALVTSWLETLLQHFGVHELDKVSDQKLVVLLKRCGAHKTFVLQDTDLLCALKRRIVRLAGAQLDDAFISMAPDVIDEDELEAVALAMESCHTKGGRYQQRVYRLLKSFELCHRLQAFCLGHTLHEQKIPYLITRSAERFAVWGHIRALPGCCSLNHLTSRANFSDLGC